MKTDHLSPHDTSVDATPGDEHLMLLEYETPRLRRLGTVLELTQGAAAAPRPDSGPVSF